MPDRVRTRRQFSEFSSPTGRGSSGPLRISFVKGALGANSVAVAYAINKKVGNAVIRNRIRRRLRSVFDHLNPQPLTGTYLIRVGIEAGNLSYDELQHHTRQALSRARVFPQD